ncbi:MAG: hypothetical protein GY874_01555 [Desulfobacteraceae bacterium]|nr:hypothetical protein [Desulfobacteraceae bacterium]
MTAFIIEHQCPQCGAPAQLEETDRLFRCTFCRAGSYLTAPDYMRHLIPPKAPAGKNLFFIPYWRFKGMFFTCLSHKMEKRFIDVSRQAVSSKHFPLSMGFRGQTQKLRFAVTQEDGIFIKPQITADCFLQSLDEYFNSRIAKPILHHAHIGETLSLLYAPFYLDNKLYDAVLNKPVSAVSQNELTCLIDDIEKADWPLNFIATLCPQCGWDLIGERDSLALTCGNCETAWWEKQGRLTRIEAAHVAGSDENTMHMPFWRIRANVSHIDLNTYTDLVKTANLAKAPQPGWDKIPFYFWSPAFKVRPQSLLTFATQVTLTQPVENLETGPPKGRLQPVTMPFQEAVETLKPMVSSFLRPRERISEIIPQLTIEPRKMLLVYLPFREGHHEFIHEKFKLAINKNILAHSKNL